MTDPFLPLVLALPRDSWSHGWLALHAAAPRLDQARAAEFERYIRRALRRATRRGFRNRGPALVALAGYAEPTWEPPCRIDDMDELQAALARLDPRERRVLVARALGRGRATIAAREGLSAGYVGQLERAAIVKARGA